MDLVLDFFDDHLLDEHVYGNTTSLYMQRYHPVRQSLSLLGIMTVSAFALYFFCNTVNYFTVYRMQNLGHHPFKGQTTAEIKMASAAIPFMAALQVPIALAEIHGYTKLYGPGEKYSWEDYGGWKFLPLNLIWFLIFTDFIIYWVHRLLHHPILYKALHKPHHKWKNPTPFASHAFHPVDGWAQGLAYHIYVVFFPMHKVVHLVALILVNIWTTSIHDGVSFFPWWWLNGAAHHTIHHTDFNYNYGQYVIFWDWFFGSYRDPREQGRVLHPDTQKAIRAEQEAAVTDKKQQ